MVRILDISPPVSSRIGVWPGDVPFRREVSRDLQAGHTYTLSAMHTTLHVGAHADAPSHYRRGGQPIDARPLHAYLGTCQVVVVSLPRGARVQASDLPQLRAPRVLVRTDSFPDPEEFTTDFNSLSPSAVRTIADAGGLLVGIDTPSIDPFDDTALLAHQAVADADLCVLEGLVLAHVPAGLYTLSALPLRLVGADAAPVRAVLVQSEGGDALPGL